MNTWQLSPRKDYAANRLRAGALQLVPGTHLLVDETALEPGRLSEVGVRNLAALGQVIQHQTVAYDFQFHKTEFECDLVSVGVVWLVWAWPVRVWMFLSQVIYNRWKGERSHVHMYIEDTHMPYMALRLSATHCSASPTACYGPD